MERLKLLIAEGTEAFRIALLDALRGAYRVHTCDEGQQALQMMQEFKPDMMILDLMLPGLDGITLLQRAAESGLRPMVLATTSYHNPYILESLQKLGVGYVMIKPCDLRATIARLADLSQQIHAPVVSQPDPDVQISNLLLALGFQTRHHGYAYLRTAIGLMAADFRQSITKELYPAVAKEFKTDQTSVERCMRTAIEKAWKTGDRKLWKLYFEQEERPTNGECIRRLAEALGHMPEK